MHLDFVPERVSAEKALAERSAKTWAWAFKDPSSMCIYLYAIWLMSINKISFMHFHVAQKDLSFGGPHNI